MKHLQIFETEAALEAAKANLEQPWVALTEDDKNVHFMEGGEPTPTYEFVDLGLPSGLKWAKCNIGATSETDYGLYFQWGDTVGYTAEQVASGEKVFDWENYKYCNGSLDTLTKYNTSTKYGKNPDNKTIIEAMDDAATVHMGEGWSMPTESDFNELLDGTTNAWVTDYNGSGINGRLFTSNTNGNTLFIPAAGFALGSSMLMAGSVGYTWSSSLYTLFPEKGRFLDFSSGLCDMHFNSRYDGCSVRGVRK